MAVRSLLGRDGTATVCNGSGFLATGDHVPSLGAVSVPPESTLIRFHRLEAVRTALAAVGAAFASLLHDEAAAESGKAALEAAAAALALRWLLLIVHLLLGRVGLLLLLVLLGRVLLGRVLLVVRLQAIAKLVTIGKRGRG